MQSCNNLDDSIESLLGPDYPWGVQNNPSMVRRVAAFAI